jgi:hypothetical protein
MKKQYKRILALLFLVSLSLSLSVPLLADPGAPGGDPASGSTSTESVGGSSSGVPLDGGVLELFIAGVGYMAYRKAKTFFARKESH